MSCYLQSGAICSTLGHFLWSDLMILISYLLTAHCNKYWEPTSRLAIGSWIKLRSHDQLPISQGRWMIIRVTTAIGSEFEVAIAIGDPPKKFLFFSPR
jgi:hypothetical protein